MESTASSRLCRRRSSAIIRQTWEPHPDWGALLFSDIMERILFYSKPQNTNSICGANSTSIQSSSCLPILSCHRIPTSFLRSLRKGNARREARCHLQALQPDSRTCYFRRPHLDCWGAVMAMLFWTTRQRTGRLSPSRPCATLPHRLPVTCLVRVCAKDHVQQRG